MLSEREHNVAQLLLSGKSAGEAASALGVRPAAISKALRRIRTKSPQVSEAIAVVREFYKTKELAA